MDIRQVDMAALTAAARAASRRWRGVIIHHFASPWARDYRGRATWEGVWRYHVRDRKWSDIGYHWGVGANNDLWLLRYRDAAGFQGPMNAFGAHCVGYNATHAGAVLAGNFDEENPHQYGYRMLISSVAAFLQVRNLKPEDVHFHREFANKTCPGYNLSLWTVRQDVGRAMGNAATGLPHYDPRPPVPLYAVVIGSMVIDCSPKIYDNRLYVLAEPYCEALGATIPKGVHVQDSGYALAEALTAGIGGWRLFYSGPAPERMYHRWYPKRLEWIEEDGGV